MKEGGVKISKQRKDSKNDYIVAKCPYYISSNEIRITCAGGDVGVEKTMRYFINNTVKKNYFSLCESYKFKYCPIYQKNIEKGI